MENASRSTVIPALRYKDAQAAIEWLCNVLGCTKHVVYANPDGTIAHAELALGGGMIMLGTAKDDLYGQWMRSPGDLGEMETRSCYVIVADADAAYARAQAAGAAIPRPIENTFYGSREFTVRDPEGHSWSVGTYDPWKAQS
jgi:uncharacterized glyoxalase superfamily protein PhnB